MTKCSSGAMTSRDTKLMRQALDALVGLMAQPETGLVYDASIVRAITAIADLHDRLAEPVHPVEQWQPIETAPKDGTKVMLLSKVHGHIIARCGHRMRHQTGDRWDVYAGATISDVTHWMPLPAAPGAAPTVQPVAVHSQAAPARLTPELCVTEVNMTDNQERALQALSDQAQALGMYDAPSKEH